MLKKKLTKGDSSLSNVRTSDLTVTGICSSCQVARAHKNILVRYTTSISPPPCWVTLGNLSSKQYASVWHQRE